MICVQSHLGLLVNHLLEQLGQNLLEQLGQNQKGEASLSQHSFPCQTMSHLMHSHACMWAGLDTHSCHVHMQCTHYLAAQQLKLCA